MTKTKIEWASHVWNPTRGCRRVSPGCENCYAERVAARFSGPGLPYEGLTKNGRWNGEVKLGDLAAPLHWRKPARIFVDSMSDLFYEEFTDEKIAAVFGVMAACPQHTFQVLTKRPERAVKWFAWIKRQAIEVNAGRGMSEAAFCLAHAQKQSPNVALTRNLDEIFAQPWPLPNVHIGISIEDQKRADERLPELLRIPAAVRFVSFEPALGPVNWLPWVRKFPGRMEPPLDWLIIGGESGPSARPFDIAWARNTIEQCKAAGVPVFMKQLGAHCVNSSNGQEPERNTFGGKWNDPKDWPPDLRVREFPNA